MTMLRFSGGSRTSGYVIVTDPDAPHGMVEEGETLSCCHCQAFWIIKPGSGTKRGWCFRCSGPLCGKEVCLESCTPWERAIEAMEARGRLFEAIDREQELSSRDAREELLRRG